MVDLTSHSMRIQGGSTLTQQLMKNFFLTRNARLKRKLKEVMMAYIAERNYSQGRDSRELHQRHLSGQRGQEGIYGIWEASEYYFSKEPRDLTHR